MGTGRGKFTVGEQFIINWQYNRLGGFYAILADLISHADEHHLNLLSLAFPEEVGAYKRFAQVRGWWEMLDEGWRSQSHS